MKGRYPAAHLAAFTLGIAPVDAAIADHGLRPNLGGRPVEIVLWTDDTDRDHARLTAEGVPSLSKPHDWLSDLRLAWVAVWVRGRAGRCGRVGGGRPGLGGRWAARGW